jgi:microcompartment protein CcmK/EutM
LKLGRVTGKIISTRKSGNMDGLKILVVNYLDEKLSDTKKSAACIDTVGAGDNDIVLLCSSSSARLTDTTEKTAADIAIIGIIDSISAGRKYIYKRSDGE